MLNQPGIDDWYRQKILPAVRSDILRESDEQILWSDLSELQPSTRCIWTLAKHSQSSG